MNANTNQLMSVIKASGELATEAYVSHTLRHAPYSMTATSINELIDNACDAGLIASTLIEGVSPLGFNPHPPAVACLYIIKK